MDEKEEDKSEESLQKHLVFYKKLNKTISDIQNEIQESTQSKIINHLNDRIDAIKLDQSRIRKLFPDVDDKTWMSLDKI
ncbi:MAG TPA: hypothetical protein VMW55_02525 [Nitrosopumilaceae archaeon]|nr:hypothetical protein [Nitrosopumilaceae archaeon]